jgi:hypothetical protein
VQVSQALGQRAPSVESAAALGHFAIVLHLLTNTLLRPLVVTPHFIQQLSGLVRTAWPVEDSTERNAFGTQLQHALGAMLQEEVLRTHSEAIVTQLVPSLCEVCAFVGCSPGV